MLVQFGINLIKKQNSLTAKLDSQLRPRPVFAVLGIFLPSYSKLDSM